MKRTSVFAASLMCSVMLSAQTYVNVELKDGSVRSYSAELTSKVVFGEKEEADPTSINGHACVKLAGYYWATENVGECLVPAMAGPGTDGNGWNLYYYEQTDNYAMSAALLWGHEGGHAWTLPSKAQWQALIDGCYWEWTDSYGLTTSPYNGKTGYIVYEAESDGDKGQCNKENSGYSPATSTHIFLPAAGIRYEDRIDVFKQGYIGCYWSADDKSYLGLFNVLRNVYDDDDSNYGYAVRPVSE